MLAGAAASTTPCWLAKLEWLAAKVEEMEGARGEAPAEGAAEAEGGPLEGEQRRPWGASVCRAAAAVREGAADRLRQLAAVRELKLDEEVGQHTGGGGSSS